MTKTYTLAGVFNLFFNPKIKTAKVQFQKKA